MNHRLSLQSELQRERAKFITRRWFFHQCGVGLGSIELESLLGRSRPCIPKLDRQGTNELNISTADHALQ